MLVKFTVGNFLSFKRPQVLSMEPESFKEFPNNLLIPYLFDENYRLLKSVAIYGHNSYGKTNFIKAFSFLHSLIFNSFSIGQQKKNIDVEPFRLNTEMTAEPSVFEIVFLARETKYRYKVILNSEEIVYEQLAYSEAKVRENNLFERKGQDFIISKSWNKEANNSPQNSILFTKRHILYLSVLLSQDDIPRISSVRKWFESNVVIPDSYLDNLAKARSVYSNVHYRDLILKFIEKADIGFKTIFDKVETMAKSGIEKGLLNMWYDNEIKDFELYTNHIIYNAKNEAVGNVEFELQKHESAGSIKYFVLVCLIAYAIRNMQILWIDELDARFDSGLLEMLVSSFHDQEINPVNAQMIFTTHNTVLLDNKLRRDQMIVVEKDKYGESKLRRMHSSDNPIRAGKSVEKQYRRGKLGGVSKNVRKNIGPTLFDDID